MRASIRHGVSIQHLNCEEPTRAARIGAGAGDGSGTADDAAWRDRRAEHG